MYQSITTAHVKPLALPLLKSKKQDEKNNRGGN
jgi:hypothetical protein